ncbi:single-stranded DNA-binding protein [Paenirhodobacter enshiensis]|uniref:single-stranded DNA-binding protein n=1 Tax=Paenirhodobacter enshiensis TaxID=1105367 RepID=UPI0035B0E183
MADLNKVCLLGRLGADPEIRSTQSGEKVATFRMATSEQWKAKDTGEKKERTEWHTIVAWGPLAKLAEAYLRKGNRVHIEGPQRTRKWQDQNGNDRWSTEVVLSGFGARLDIIDWPEGVGGGASRGQDDAYGGDQLPPGGSNYDDEIPF